MLLRVHRLLMKSRYHLLPLHYLPVLKNSNRYNNSGRELEPIKAHVNDGGCNEPTEGNIVSTIPTEGNSISTIPTNQGQTKIKRRRGPMKMNSVYTRRIEDRPVFTLNHELQPVCENRKMRSQLGSFLGTIGRQCVPLDYVHWTKVPEEEKNGWWEFVIPHIFFNLLVEFGVHI